MTTKKIYLIRQDAVPVDFVNSLRDIVKTYVNEEVEFRIFNSDDITTDVTGCISLDRYIKDEYSIDVSRLFDIYNSQSRAIDMVSLGTSIEEQFKSIPAGDYKLVDDDSATGFGFTMNFVVQGLKKYGVNITSTDILVRSLISDGEEIYDVIDAIDFYLGAEGGGLVSKFHQMGIR